MKIHSIFRSINGEICSCHQGSLTTFIRFWGCNCRCNWCDSQFSYTGEPKIMTINQILQQIPIGTKNITITGGEPLIQKGTMNLIWRLLEQYSVSVETNGTKFIPSNPEKVSWIIDYKLPSSGCENQMKIKNFRNVNRNDFVKFVVADRKDFERSLEIIPLIIQGLNYGLECPTFAFSPVWGSLKPETLAQWMIENEDLCGIGAVYSLQIHKILNVL